MMNIRSYWKDAIILAVAGWFAYQAYITYRAVWEVVGWINGRGEPAIARLVPVPPQPQAPQPTPTKR